MLRLLFLFFVLLNLSVKSQSDSVFLVQDIRVKGNQRTDEDAIIILSRLKMDQWIQVPGRETTNAIKLLWESGDFKTIEIIRRNVKNGIDLIIRVEEYYLLGDVTINGLSKSETREVLEYDKFLERTTYSPQTIHVIENRISSILNDKGYLFTEISIDSVKTENDRVNFTVNVKKGGRFRVFEIGYENKENLTTDQLNRSLVNIHPRRYFVIPGSLYESNAETELKNIQDYCRIKGFPFATAFVNNVVIVGNRVLLTYALQNMEPYRFGKFIWEGNEVISDSLLNSVVRSLPGANYNKAALNSKLYFAEDYSDISSLYYEKGYAGVRIMHQLEPRNDSVIDVKVLLSEGKKMQFGQVNVVGNVRTKDNVILREVVTLPGKDFSRSAILISQQKLMQLDYFKNNKMDVRMNTDTATGTVDLTYVVEERISDKFLLSGGYGSGSLIGTAALNFKNFSAKDMFKKGTKWSPLPAGGGQQLSIKVQTDGVGYYGFSFSFYEPWLRNKPRGLSLSSSVANFKDTVGSLNFINSDIAFVHKPFSHFSSVSYGLSYKRYNPNNYDVFGQTTGHFNALSLQLRFIKNTTNSLFFPTEGMYIKGESTSSLPPYSRYTEQEALSLTTQEKFKWFEYYKLKFAYKGYAALSSNKSWVMATSFGVGYLGSFNKNIGTIPFQRFLMGGTGLTNYSILANDYIGLRGYEAGSISSTDGDAFAVKYSLELRKKLFEYEQYMFTMHAFMEGGNSLSKISLLDPYQLNNAIGFGAKVYAPIIAVVGLDVGWGFNKSNFSWNVPTVQVTLGLNVGDF